MRGPVHPEQRCRYTAIARIGRCTSRARRPTRRARSSAVILERERPDVVVFDSAGRASSNTGARSSLCPCRNPSVPVRRLVARASATGARRWIDEHWIVAPRFAAGGRSGLERLRDGSHRTANRVLDVLHEPWTPGYRRPAAIARRRARRHTCSPVRAAAECLHAGRMWAQVFLDASAQLSTRLGPGGRRRAGSAEFTPPQPTKPLASASLASLPNAGSWGSCATHASVSSTAAACCCRRSRSARPAWRRRYPTTSPRGSRPAPRGAWCDPRRSTQRRS